MTGSFYSRVYLLLILMTNSMAFEYNDKDLLFISTYNTMAHELYYSEISPAEGVSATFFNRLYRDDTRNIGSDGGLVYDSGESTLYWTNNEQYTVEKFNLAAYSHTVVFTSTSPGYPDMDIDPIERRIYLSGATKIDYFPIDGEARLSTFMEVGYAIYDIVIDATNRYLYMAIFKSGTGNVIQRVSLADSTAVDVLKTDSSINPPKLALSPNKIYWLIGFPAFIEEADLDGGNIRTFNNFPSAVLGSLTSMVFYDKDLLGIMGSGNMIQEIDFTTEEIYQWSYDGLQNIERICKHIGVQKPSTMSMRTTEENSEESSSALVYVIIAVIVCVLILIAITAFICYRRSHSEDTNKNKNAVSYRNDDTSKDKAKLAGETYEVPMSTVNNAYIPPYDPPAPPYEMPAPPYEPPAPQSPPVPSRNSVEVKPEDDYLYMYSTIDQVGLYDNNVKKEC